MRGIAALIGAFVLTGVALAQTVVPRERESVWAGRLEIVTPFERVNALSRGSGDRQLFAQGASGGLLSWRAGVQNSAKVLREPSSDVILCALGNRGVWASVDASGTLHFGRRKEEVWKRDLSGFPGSLALSWDGSRLALGMEDGTLELRETAEAKLLWSEKLSERAVVALAFGERELVAGTEAGAVFRRGLDGKGARGFTTDLGAIRCLAFRPDGEALAVGGSDHAWAVWELKGGPKKGLEGTAPVPWITAVGWGQGGGLSFAAGSCLVGPDGRMRSLVAGEVTAVLSEGELAVIGGSDGCVYTHHHGGGNFCGLEVGHIRDLLSVVWAPAGSWVASGGMDGELRLWDPEGRRGERRVLRGHRGAIVDLSAHPEGDLIASVGSDATLRVWSVREEKEVWRFPGHEGRLGCCAWSPCGRYLASGDSGGVVRVFRWPEGEQVAHFRHHDEDMKCLAWDEQERWLATGSADGAIGIIDRKSWELDRVLRCRSVVPMPLHVHGLDFDPEGERLISGHLDATLRVWSCSSWKETACLQGHTASIEAVDVHPSGTMVLSCSGDRTLRLWDLASQECLRVYRGHELTVVSAGFDRSGTRIASASSDHLLRFWNLEEEASVGTASERQGAVTALSLRLDPNDGATLFDVLFSDGVVLTKPTSSIEGVGFIGHLPRASSLVGSGSSFALSTVNGQLGDRARVGERVIHLGGSEEETKEQRAVVGLPDGVGLKCGVRLPAAKAWMVIGTDGILRLISRADGSLLRTIETDTLCSRLCAASEKDALVALEDGRVLKVSVEAEVEDVLPAGEAVTAFAVSGDDIAVGRADGSLHLRVGTTWKQRTAAHRGAVRSLCFRPQDLFSGGDDHLTRRWSRLDLSGQGVFGGHAGPVTAIAALGSLVVSADDQGELTPIRTEGTHRPERRAAYGTTGLELPVTGWSLQSLRIPRLRRGGEEQILELELVGSASLSDAELWPLLRPYGVILRTLPGVNLHNGHGFRYRLGLRALPWAKPGVAQARFVVGSPFESEGSFNPPHRVPTFLIAIPIDG